VPSEHATIASRTGSECDIKRLGTAFSMILSRPGLILFLTSPVRGCRKSPRGFLIRRVISVGPWQIALRAYKSGVGYMYMYVVTPHTFGPT
jgi:hypothetical protein